MSEVQPVPEGVHTVVPRLVFTRGAGTKAMQLYVDAFGAQVVEEPHLMPDGQLIHAHIRIGDASVFLTDEGDEGRRAPGAEQVRQDRRDSRPGEHGRAVRESAETPLQRERQR